MRPITRQALGIVMALLMSITLIAACSPPTPAPSPTPKPSLAPSPTSSPTPKPTAAPSPAPSPSPTAKPAEGAAAFYKGKIVTMLVPYAAGGGTDYGGRVLASMWSDFVEGSTMIVKNMAGAGGVVGANYMATAKADGLTLAITEAGSGLMTPILFEDPGAKFDPKKFIYVGAFGYGPSYFAVGKNSKYTSAKDMVGANGFKFNSTGKKGDSAFGAAIVSRMFQMQNSKLVAGYDGTGEQGLSMARGETDGGVTASFGADDWLAKGFVKPPFMVLDTDRTPWFPDVPTLNEVVKVATPRDQGELNLMMSVASRKPVFLPPGVPDDRVAFLKSVFDKIMNDAGFQTLAKKQWRVWQKPITGEAYAKLLSDTLASGKDVIGGLTQEIDRMGG